MQPLKKSDLSIAADSLLDSALNPAAGVRRPIASLWSPKVLFYSIKSVVLETCHG